MTHTTNYNLSQWDAADRILRSDFNSDNAKIDAAMKALASSVSGKASASAFNALSKTVSSHTTTLAKKGNCQVYQTSYTGTGTHGVDYKNSLTFPSKPMVVIITGGGTRMTMYQGTAYAWADDSNGLLGHAAYITWSGNIVSWYSDDYKAQMNAGRDTPYNVIALLQAD